MGNERELIVDFILVRAVVDLWRHIPYHSYHIDRLEESL